ncbi:hypothetical protein ACP3WZ_25640, partial [Salmonella enterica]
ELIMSPALWTAGDVGKYVSINGGLAKIIAFTSSERVSAQALSPIETTVAAPPLAWALMENAWNNSTRGYPRAVTINKQRLYYA